MPVQAVNAQQKAIVSSPIRSLVCRHAGPVHAISASRHDPALFVSCGLDGQVRVCSSLARAPLLELTPSDSYLFSAQWSPHRPMLFAVGAGDRSLQLCLEAPMHAKCSGGSGQAALERARPAHAVVHDMLFWNNQTGPACV